MLPQDIVWGHKMQFIRTVATTAIVALCVPGQAFVSGPAWGKTLSSVDGPAEKPPASYSGKQYVDSNGCIFVRAGYDGNVNWVPRVTRDKKVICGYKPTFAQGAVPQPTPAPKPAPEIVVAAPAPKPAPRAVGAPIETVAVKTDPPRIRVAPAAQPAPVVAAAPAPRVVAPKPKPPTPQQIAYAIRTACPQYDKVAQDHMLLVNGYPVRCGPQTEIPGGRPYALAAGGGAGAGAGAAAPVAAPKPAAPAGYKVAWSDDRLNTRRGPQTAAGDAQMAQVFEPGKVPMVPKKVTRTAAAPRGVAQGGAYVVATKNAPQAVVPAPAAAAGKAYVQVGTFGVAANATATAARLKAAGLPVAMATVSQGGKTLQIVLAGPFTSTAQLQNGLTLARRAGFKDAFARN